MGQCNSRSHAPSSVPQVSIAQVYANVNSGKPRQYWDHSKHRIRWGELDDYKTGHHLGGGHFSRALEAVRIKDGEKVVVKVLWTDRRLLNREVKVLETLRGGPNIVRLLDTVLHRPTGTKALVFEHVANTAFRVLIGQMTELHVRHYTRQLLQALDFCHSQGVIHRDVKPDNVMIDHAKGTLRLIDMGQAAFYFPGKLYGVQVGTRHYKAPELLLEQRQYHYSLDMWSVGCMLASMIFGKVPFFPGEDNADQLVTIATVLGSARLERYISAYRMPVVPTLTGFQGHPGVSWHSLVHWANKHLVTYQALDLLDRLLVYDHGQRITACQALEHLYLSLPAHSTTPPTATVITTPTPTISGLPATEPTTTTTTAITTTTITSTSTIGFNI